MQYIDLDKFWMRVDVRGEDDCWEWLGARDINGYGRFNNKWEKKQIAAHRVIWELKFGEIPEGVFVCHRCDNPPCINPNHLFLCTPRENFENAKRKGRNKRKGRVVGQPANDIVDSFEDLMDYLDR